MRGGFIDKNTTIRISFAYLYRIFIDGKYLLVKNARGTGKYQPVGGVYKMQDSEKQELKNLSHMVDDDKIQIDKSSKNDYRLRLDNRYIRKFMKRFDTEAQRERINSLGREFEEELISTGILSWSEIKYRVCGRHIANIEFGKHFQVYELLLVDIVELIPTPEQEEDLRKLMEHTPDNICFASAEKIKALGIEQSTGNLFESIGDHTINILQETESKLTKVPHAQAYYTVML